MKMLWASSGGSRKVEKPRSLTPSTNDDTYAVDKKAVIYCIVAGINNIHERMREHNNEY